MLLSRYCSHDLSGQCDALSFLGSLINYRHWPIYLIPKRFLFPKYDSINCPDTDPGFAGMDPAYFLRKWLLPRKNETINISRRGKISAVLIAALLSCCAFAEDGKCCRWTKAWFIFSKNPFLNQAAINPVWHLGWCSGEQDWQTKILFIFCGWRCRKIVHQLYNSNNDSFPQILTTKKSPMWSFYSGESYRGCDFFTRRWVGNFSGTGAANDGRFLFLRFIQAEHERSGNCRRVEWMACHTVSFHYAFRGKISTTAFFA